MEVGALLDGLLVPRPGASPGLEQVTLFAADTLAKAGAHVSFLPFASTPHGFALVWAVNLALFAAWAVALLRGHHRIAMALPLLAAGLLLAEFEALRSPVSGWLPAREFDVIGRYPGAPDGPLLVFVAHLDTTTHFGDHRHWGPTGWLLGPATALAVLLPAFAAWRARRGAPLRRRWLAGLAALALVPAAAMFAFQTLGPLLRAPSPGALDDGGSLAAALLLAERLAERPAGAPSSVEIALVAAEEERALGSRAFARRLPRDRPVVVVNLEGIGGPGRLGLVPEDGFELRRFESPPALLDWIDAAIGKAHGAPLPRPRLPLGTLTDGRSFLAEGFAATSLRPTFDGKLPPHLHSAADSRDRLSEARILEAVALLRALVAAADRHPASLKRFRPASDQRDAAAISWSSAVRAASTSTSGAARRRPTSAAS